MYKEFRENWKIPIIHSQRILFIAYPMSLEWALKLDYTRSCSNLKLELANFKSW